MGGATSSPPCLKRPLQVNHPGVLAPSPKDHLYPERLHELLGNVSNLEIRLEMETQQKEEAVAKADTLCGRVAELEQQLELLQQQLLQQRQPEQQLQQAEAEKKHEASVEAEAQLDSEKVKMLEIRVADLEKQLEDQNHSRTESSEQVSSFFSTPAPNEPQKLTF